MIEHRELEDVIIFDQATDVLNVGAFSQYILVNVIIEDAKESCCPGA